ncbi:hypothetical protein CHS0354_011748 [Potamilus streckersoni]|uniref:Uncharacterized protein n=1 Tax=Potamilus streckersoni TaxID=2493646 RepID=A0AAE0TAA1_9BIVA|nr:hypothetical protein CHS0354_011748 [Potamilus streckersoni]
MEESAQSVHVWMKACYEKACGNRIIGTTLQYIDNPTEVCVILLFLRFDKGMKLKGCKMYVTPANVIRRFVLKQCHLQPLPIVKLTTSLTATTG